MTIRIKQLTFETIIGILEHERHTPQRVVVDVAMEYEYSKGVFIDYAKVAQEIEELVIKQRFKLLEEAIEAIEILLTHRYSKLLKSLSIEMQKPDILEHCIVSLSKSVKF
ncbi:MAG: hypothetical protein KU38_02890 [Sulfurovum sp. FS08-3]|nr:MAG: hypothetical protein KU38_02890 [Sulfurovum sp. FS08-3]